jgi:hypothetical protein
VKRNLGSESAVSESTKVVTLKVHEGTVRSRRAHVRADRSRLCCIGTLSVGTVSKHCQVARCTVCSRCERMGLNVAHMGSWRFKLWT